MEVGDDAGDLARGRRSWNCADHRPRPHLTDLLHTVENKALHTEVLLCFGSFCVWRKARKDNNNNFLTKGGQIILVLWKKSAEVGERESG